MARTYTLVRVDTKKESLNLYAVVQVHDDETGEKYEINGIFATDLTAEKLAERIGVIEANVAQERKIAKSELESLVGSVITPILPTPTEPDAKQLACQAAMRDVQNLADLVRLAKVAGDDAYDAEFAAAFQVLKDARAALGK